MLELLKAADLCGQLLNLVVKKVEHFQILQFRHVRWYGYGNRDVSVNTGPRSSRGSQRHTHRLLPSHDGETQLLRGHLTHGRLFSVGFS